MKRIWVSLLLSACMLTSAVNMSWASLSEGRFTPCLKNQTPSGVSQEISYRIHKGDTLWSIARHYGIKMENLMMINRLDEKSILTVGKTLQIPGTNARVHIVKSGETLWQIANNYGIGLEELQQLNRDKPANKLQVGERLILPSAARSLALTQSSSRGLSLGSGFYAWPIMGTITSAYGWRKSGFHHGLDIAGKVGDPIRAAANGTVNCADYQPIYGRTIILEHDNGKKTVYAHLEKIYVEKGREVKRGKIIGTVGTSGRTTGPHLHFEIRAGDKTINPVQLLR
ncbi:MAG: M23 family metallopeptidase [Syntrophomonas sp.]|uniref:peptidoglycan DD-metalloendopeptidase family protein n=1 Tax=Syntrophomonas sp. TaxID=2053627 RepID=UPI00260E7534|nr:M23 family metallopeptidase [Syntrophomonas sp.]MDD4625513.1 M23 family metallopeptidase [Syntrophomonas sp.]